MGYPVTEISLGTDGLTLDIGAGATVTVHDGATITGLTGATTFASKSEAIAGTNTTKVISPARLHDALVAYQPMIDAEFTIGTESNHLRNVAIQLEDADDANLAARASCMAYLSDDAYGDSVAATAPTGAAAIGTDGLAIELVTKKTWLITSESNGHIDFNITNSSAKSFYFVVVLPSGELVVSAAITFAG